MLIPLNATADKPASLFKNSETGEIIEIKIIESINFFKRIEDEKNCKKKRMSI